MIYRIFTEKKHNVSAARIRSEIKNLLGIHAEDVKEILRYDVEGLSEKEFEQAIPNFFSEPPVDYVYREQLPDLPNYRVFAIAFLDGQYDQRADSAAQCVQLLTQKAKPIVKCARIIAVKGVSEDQMVAIKKYLINPVEAEEVGLEKPASLARVTLDTVPVGIVDGFTEMSDEEVGAYHASIGFAMTADDLRFVRDYYRNEKRNPTETELKVIDTYWSDHCRHTTFTAELKDVTIDSENPNVKAAYALYQKLFAELNGARKDKYPCLMDIGTIAAKKMKKEGRLNDLDLSDEINACSIEVEIEVDGEKVPYLVMFKNETHNHPTEIEPFGGAATCLGGAIRDPLSGRTYVYQAMRITGASDPNEKLADTLPGKLPQRVITRTAAAGFSSYGNQIGLATGIVDEVYHPGYKAKRLETGYVVGAAPKSHVYREKPKAGDVVVLLGGETGRDGCGGATGSSKAHTAKSVELCGAEVQKGNPLTERKLQRLFMNAEVTRMIKKCNDFGAGGVSVAIGELADGLLIDLDKVPKKYEGLSGTELAISESQERMAVVIAKEDVEKFVALSEKENLQATVVATVTEQRRMKMLFKGDVIVDISRDFLDTNGVKQSVSAHVQEKNVTFFDDKQVSFASGVKSALSHLNVCSKKGLSERFDSTIGARSVFMPFGGKHQLTPVTAMAAKIPVKGETDAATVSTWGYSPDLMSESPFLGAVYSVVCSVAKQVAAGCDKDRVRLTFQEFFMKLGRDAKRWGVPLSALLGALSAQIGLGLAAIGGKDSMSGSFEQIDVPPTLISFALAPAAASKLITNVADKAGRKLYLLPMKKDASHMPDFDYLNDLYAKVYKMIDGGNVAFATVVEKGGVAAAVVKSCLGNGLGFTFATDNLFAERYGDVIVAVDDESVLCGVDYVYLGQTTDSGVYTDGKQCVTFDEARASFEGTLEPVFHTTAAASGELPNCDCLEKAKTVSVITRASKPRVFIPAFPGTNCEIDTMRRFEKAGAEVELVVVRNRSASEIEQSVQEIAAAVKRANIIAFPGGFSGGDEPDGSGKFIATTFRNPQVADAVTELLSVRDGLAIGICNGFQALVKLGLVPHGAITEMTEDSPTLTFNNIGRHVSTLVDIRVASTKSPWLSNCKVGDVFTVPVSHGEGKFLANDAWIQKLIAGGQVATQYADASGKPTMVSPYNPNGSVAAIEGITSPDGRVFGKMGHSERIGENLMKNFDGNFDMKIFEAGVNYFKI